MAPPFVFLTLFGLQRDTFNTQEMAPPFTFLTLLCFRQMFLILKRWRHHSHLLLYSVFERCFKYSRDGATIHFSYFVRSLRDAFNTRKMAPPFTFLTLFGLQRDAFNTREMTPPFTFLRSVFKNMLLMLERWRHMFYFSIFVLRYILSFSYYLLSFLFVFHLWHSGDDVDFNSISILLPLICFCLYSLQNL